MVGATLSSATIIGSIQLTLSFFLMWFVSFPLGLLCHRFIEIFSIYAIYTCYLLECLVDWIRALEDIR